MARFARCGNFFFIDFLRRFGISPCSDCDKPDMRTNAAGHTIQCFDWDQHRVGRDHRLRGVPLAGSRLAAASPVTEAPGIQLRVRVPFFCSKKLVSVPCVFLGCRFCGSECSEHPNAPLETPQIFLSTIENALDAVEHHPKCFNPCSRALRAHRWRERARREKALFREVTETLLERSLGYWSFTC